MHDSAHLLTCLSSIFEWLGEASAGPRAEGVRRALQHSRDTFEEVWRDYLPTEREEVVEQLLVRVCRSYCMGTVNANKISYSHIDTLVRAGHAPQDSLSPQLGVEAARQVMISVNKIVAVFNANLAHPAAADEQADRAIKWADALEGPSGITAHKLVRLGRAGARIVTGMLAEIARRAEAAARRGVSLRDVEVALVDNRANMVAAADKKKDTVYMSYNVRLLATAGDEFAQKLTPERQQRVVDHAREVVYEACADFHGACRRFFTAYRRAVATGGAAPPVPTLPAAEKLLRELTLPFYLPRAFDPRSRAAGSVSSLPAPAPVPSSTKPVRRAAERERHPHVWKPYSLGR
ncbi:hypothetical protein JCM9279_000380 [Rhodotorula babjevae]